MQAQSTIGLHTSGQIGAVDPRYESIVCPCDKVNPFIINGCSVSFTSNSNGSDDSIKAVREILMSAYRTRNTSRE